MLQVFDASQGAWNVECGVKKTWAEPPTSRMVICQARFCKSDKTRRRQSFATVALVRQEDSIQNFSVRCQKSRQRCYVGIDVKLAMILEIDVDRIMTR
jgi:hypothetical protein